MFGYSQAEAIGQHISLLFVPDLQGDYLKPIDQLRRGERIERYEAVRVAKDGAQIEIAVTLSAVRLPTDEIVGVSAVYRDITRRNLREAELVKAKETAESGNRAKSQFLDNMSHELRTPLNGVLGMADVLMDTPLSEEQQEYLGVIRDSARALLNLLSGILDYTQLESGTLSLRTSAVPIRDVIERVTSRMCPRAEAKGLRLLTFISEDTPSYLLTDPVRLCQVLDNLVDNAIKFTSTGTVEIRVERPPEGRAVRFSVVDTGPGIPPTERAMIFEAFTQLDASSTRKAGGTGLGLAVATRIVELMGGRMWVESDGASGSTLHFTVIEKSGLPSELG